MTRSKMMFTLLLCLSFAVHLKAQDLPEAPIVELTLGKVKGITTKAIHGDAKPVFNYNAIPFGKSPVGGLRFKPPQPYTDKWEGFLDGSRAKNACLSPEGTRKFMDFYLPQDLSTEYTESEDCLNLNVYTPDVSPAANLSVMVWLYGGAFGIGANQEYDGTVIAGLNDVVVVIPNYRTNVFGFLSFGPGSVCPGNAGLLDQVLALRWVQNNIHSFGGNPDSVTIFGESAGAVSVGFHLNSPMSEGLFHKAVIHSGSPVSLVTWNSAKKSKEINKLFLNTLNITDEDEEAQLNELQNIDAKSLINVAATLLAQGASFAPVLDGNFVTRNPTETLQSGKSNKVPTIIGYNDSEGMGVLGTFIPGYATGIDIITLKFLLAPILKLWKPTADQDRLFNRVVEYYMKNLDENDVTRYSKIYGTLFGQFYFQYPAVIQAMGQADQKPTYTYLGAFRLTMFHNTNYSTGLPLKPDWSNSDHGEDVFSTFGAPFLHYNLPMNAKFTDEEGMLSLEFMKYLTNFAKTGNPNIGQPVKAQWDQYNTSNFTTLKLDTRGSKSVQNDPTDMVKFFGRRRLFRIFRSMKE